ncbi:hypothetical protein N7462_007021 [Penicillium macrosclerotiorum]|uniref:uncharacterized protein n=1 Tax=Penicillium macrosclerotiorum TaxID=303699 RepID=UPI002547798B|nr:uncharacterized protein N7462_007021 [Penicillium macrosclerotiorum]KAJ5678777.1 hypothetical protein N7462_007021 [Penicillium macrosclerotiorum]
MMAAAGNRVIKTRICMISDTHTAEPRPRLQSSYAYRSPLPEADILLHAGDLTKVGYSVEHAAMVEMLKAAKAELKLVIAGNHDITLDEEYFTNFGYQRHGRPEWLGGKGILLEDDEESLGGSIRTGAVPSLAQMKAYVRRVKDMYTNESARAAGIRYLEEGVHTFTLRNGAQLTVYASPYQPEFCRWAFAYPRSQDRFNPPLPGTTASSPLNPVPDFPQIDIMLTHGPPAGVLDRVGRDPETHVGCRHLLRAAERSRPRLYLFGHIHEGWGAVRGTWDITMPDGMRQEAIPTDKEDMLEQRGAFYDMSSESTRPLQYGKETLFVNASIMTLGYSPDNAPWVVDLDLPIAEVAQP